MDEIQITLMVPVPVHLTVRMDVIKMAHVWMIIKCVPTQIANVRMVVMRMAVVFVRSHVKLMVAKKTVHV